MTAATCKSVDLETEEDPAEARADAVARSVLMCLGHKGTHDSGSESEVRRPPRSCVTHTRRLQWCDGAPLIDQLTGADGRKVRRKSWCSLLVVRDGRRVD